MKNSIKKQLILISILFILSFSCKTSEERTNTVKETSVTEKKIDPEIQLLSDQVMAIHDTAMAKMTTIRKLRTQLADDNNAVAIVQSLDNADEGMFDWMNGFDMQMYNKGRDTAVMYLKEELLKVSKMSDDIAKSINQANTYVESKK